jgi:hypothetical protein
MRHALKIHPDSPGKAVSDIAVDLLETPGRLNLRYTVTGAIADILLPATAEPARTNELWRHTCFEIFIRPAGGDAYAEFNFAPSTQWAAFQFAAYRDGMANADIPVPRITLHGTVETLTLEVSLDLARLPLLAVPAAHWHIGVSAVIEETSGARSFWALVHAPGKPDFHHADAFACNLSTAERP